MTYDKRTTPARPDLAAEHLRATVDAPRYASGRRMRIAGSCVDLRCAPRDDVSVDTQALYGEVFVVYDVDAGGWAWGQLEKDRYVGYLPASALTGVGAASTHRVRAVRTFVYPAANMKAPRVRALPLNAEVSVRETRGDFAELANGGFVWSGHLAPADEFESDFVSVAERFLHVPYLWGGKTSEGVDCSGLAQISLHACGAPAPRDTDMMAAELGAPIVVDDALRGLERGDLVFWKGHVGLMRDAATLLHANGHHMMVVSEPLKEARDRILAKSFGPIVGVRRIAV
jgi:cell wall-associated NlpC family hydrolase